MSEADGLCALLLEGHKGAEAHCPHSDALFQGKSSTISSCVDFNNVECQLWQSGDLEWIMIDASHVKVHPHTGGEGQYQGIGTSALATTPTPTPTPTPSAHPCTNVDCTRGPAPTDSMVEGNGPFTVKTINASWVSGFGGGTIHYPTNTTGKMGLIAVVPGFISAQSDIVWWGPRLASHGFVVITIDTMNGLDDENSRANQLSAALDYVINQSKNSSSPVYGKVDENRVATVGWSMGGGGTLKLATQRTLRAGIPTAPYYSGSNNFNTITTPMLIIACQNDFVTTNSSHSQAFYNRLPASNKKMYFEIANDGHFCVTTGGGHQKIMGKVGVSWMKRFIDLDTRYNQFLCERNYVTLFGEVSSVKSTCMF